MWIIYLFVAILYAGYVLLAVPTAALCGAIVYTVLLPGQVLDALVLVLARRPDGLAVPQRQVRQPRHPEPARLTYFYGQAAVDRANVSDVAIDRASNGWHRGAELAGRALDTQREDLWFTAPLGAGYAIGMTAGYLSGSALALMVWAIYVGVTWLCTLAVRGSARVLCGADTLALRLRHIRMICPTCYERVPYPAYRCRGTGCGRLHRDIRPGPYGLVRRTCECAAQLPTLLLLGTSRRLDAVCPHRGCGRPLAHRPGEAPEVVLPFFGATGAGKTRLLFGLVTALRELARRPGRSAEFADSDTARRLGDAAERLASGEVAATVTELPKGYTLRLGVGGRRWLVHLFDAAGERFYRSDRTQELQYLGKARTFVLVIDPLSVDSLWLRIPPVRRGQLTPFRSTAPSPELAYQSTQDQITAMGIDLADAHLAVVFSRFDLLGGAELADPTGDAECDLGGDVVERWAAESLGLGNLVRSARHEFGEVAFFRTAAVMNNGQVHESVLALIHWILRAERVAFESAGVGST